MCSVRATVNQAGTAVSWQDFYPYGLSLPGRGSTGTDPDRRYGWAGKELDAGAGQNLVDFGARLYDPEIGRWWGVDPLTETMPAWSPYVYGYGSPLVYIDPDGMQPVCADDCDRTYQIGTEVSNIHGIWYYLGDNQWDHFPIFDPLNFPRATGAVESAGLLDPVEWVAMGTALSRMALKAAVAGLSRSATNASTNLLGQSFGKLGTVVKKPAINISSFTKHGLNQTITRGVSPTVLKNTIANPSAVLQQSGGNFLFLTKEAAVVVTPGGRVITSYTSATFDQTVLNILQRF